jgi:serine/threonine protein kinase
MPRPMTPLTPSWLPAGYEVGPWRLVGRCGRGSYGAVYRAQAEDGRRFALKLATSPRDPRFLREVELLTRIRHPSVPQLHDHGWWTHPSGAAFPFLVMDWVEGVPLYMWATLHERTSRQVLRLLGQLAQALEVAHAAHCVHRDVKGDNILVSPEGDAFLVDFGAGNFEGASLLTSEGLPPSTAQYRSPQALRFQWEFRRHPAARYEPTPADDVYALGVTAYRLVAGSYPLLVLEAEDEQGPRFAQLEPPAARVEVCDELNALIVRMLAEDPRERISASEVALAAEHAVARAGSRADEPILPRPSWIHSVPVVPVVPMRPMRPLFRLAASALAVSVVLVALAISAQLSPPPEVPHWSDPSEEEEEAEVDEGMEDGGSSGVGPGAAELARVSSALSPSSTVGVGLDLPHRPLPGQRRPPCRPPELEIRGGCWLKIEASTWECTEVGYSWKLGCFVPSTLRPPFSTSDEL